jgi:hypothetical protein
MAVSVQELKKKFESEKQFKLFIAIGIDIMGCMSYIIPGIGELFDAFLAPLSAILVYIFFKKKLKWAAFNFIEEIIPGIDIIPSATIAWYSMYVKDQEATILEMVQEEQKKEAAFQKATGEKKSISTDMEEKF